MALEADFENFKNARTLFALNIPVTARTVYAKYRSYRVSKFREMQTCEIAEQAFKNDRETGDIKYFTFGIGRDLEEENYLEEEYALDVWHMGCMAGQPLLCYNELVEQQIIRQSKETNPPGLNR